MNMLGTLFETPLDKAQAHAYEVLRGNTPDGMRPTARQIEILRIIADRLGAKKAIKIGRLSEMVHTSPRAIKDDVRELRLLFRVRIGSSRDTIDGGYYLITTTQELLDTAAPMISQLRSEAEVIRAIAEPHELKELEGQLRLSGQGGESCA